MSERLGIAEWYGEPFLDMTPERRQELAKAAMGRIPAPRCPFQQGDQPCSKKGGVCSQRDYQPILEEPLSGRIGEAAGPIIVMCPKRFNQNSEAHRWLASIAGFDDVYVASEVPFMRSPDTGRAAGRIDLVLSGDNTASEWFALEIQAVYFSGPLMARDFQALLVDNQRLPPAPSARRRADWRSSSAKRLMPQLQVKVPTLRQMGEEARCGRR